MPAKASPRAHNRRRFRSVVSVRPGRSARRVKLRARLARRASPARRVGRVVPSARPARPSPLARELVCRAKRDRTPRLALMSAKRPSPDSTSTSLARRARRHVPRADTRAALATRRALCVSLENTPHRPRRLSARSRDKATSSRRRAPRRKQCARSEATRPARACLGACRPTLDRLLAWRAPLNSRHVQLERSRVLQVPSSVLHVRRASSIARRANLAARLRPLATSSIPMGHQAARKGGRAPL